jgi:4-amino-4-deoxy-L-arabinose transferase-like glycosyltransferase
MLAAIAVTGLGARVIYVLGFSRHIRFGLDAIWYELVAGTIASGDGFVNPGAFYGQGIVVPTAFRPPLYPAFLAVVTETVGSTRQTFQVAGCVVGTVTIVLIGLLGRRLGGPAVGLCAAALAAVYPVLLAVDASVMSENLQVPLVTGLLLVLYRAIRQPGLAWWVLVGLIAGACALNRGEGVVLVLLVVVPAALLLPRASGLRRVALAALALGAFAVVVGPWILRNEARLGEPTLATLDAGTAVAGTNCPPTYNGPNLGFWEVTCTVRPDQDSLDEVELNRRLQRDGVRYMLDHIERVPVVVAVRVLRLWGLYDPIDQSRLEAEESRNFRWQVLSWCVFAPLALLAVYGVVVLHRRRVPLLPLLAVPAAVTVTAALTYGKQRFRVSAEPVVLVAASVALVDLATRVQARLRTANENRARDS